MELIKSLIVKDFPGVKDGTILLAQDTIIEGDYGSGKTSILKAITWLLTGKDLAGYTIPNILLTTKVISRGAIDLSRDNKGLHGPIHRVLHGGVDNILARIIPGFLFSGGMSNKSIAKLISGIDIDGYKDERGKTLEQLNLDIKNYKRHNEVLSSMHYSFTHGIRGLERDINMGLISYIYNVDILIEYLALFNNLYQKLDRIGIVVKNESVNKTSEEFSKKLDEHKLFKTIIASAKKDKLMNKIIGKSKSSDILYITKKVANSLIRIKNNCSYSLGINDSKLSLKYNDLIKSTSNYGELYTERKELKKYIYKIVNQSLINYGVQISMANVLTVNVKYKGKSYTLFELPRHIRYIIEINICNLLQELESNNNGLILLDDYYLDDDDDSIDFLLGEAGAHQVIITKRVKGPLKIKTNTYEN